MIHARDVAATAAAVAAAPAAHAGHSYWLTGPALITYADVAAELSGALGRSITYQLSRRSLRGRPHFCVNTEIAT